MTFRFRLIDLVETVSQQDSHILNMEISLTEASRVFGIHGTLEVLHKTWYHNGDEIFISFAVRCLKLVLDDFNITPDTRSSINKCLQYCETRMPDFQLGSLLDDLDHLPNSHEIDVKMRQIASALLNYIWPVYVEERFAFMTMFVDTLIELYDQFHLIDIHDWLINTMIESIDKN